ncbi:DUF4856 domain-containing protein [Limibacter armeniacum]|uniref:DUF4856 domain-containing protein n=1 Tax=Limibacter armeniacum TaxID=466084 RepID=UPI002FE55C7A
MRKFLSVAAAAMMVCTFTSCDDEETTLTLPTNYSFDNVDYSGQTARINLLSTLESTIKSANDGVTKVTKDELVAIYENTNNLFDTDKNISGKTAEPFKSEAYDIFEKVELYSGSSDNIIDGRLFDNDGHEMAQMTAKGLMGALLYYQATSVYLGEEKMNVDNEEVTEGKGTTMQHHWDEAFGYFGAPASGYPETDEALWYWAKYAEEMSPAFDVRATIYDAFIEGRTAIGNKDYKARDAAIETIKTNWEKLVAACAVHYINNVIADIDANDTGSLYHHWSEGQAFAKGLLYNLDKKITTEKFNQVISLFGEKPDDAEVPNLQQANLILKDVYGFTDAEILNL